MTETNKTKVDRLKSGTASLRNIMIRLEEPTTM